MTRRKTILFTVTLIVVLIAALLPIRFGTPLARSVSVELPIGWSSLDQVADGQISTALCAGVNVTGPNVEVKEGFPFSYHRSHIFDCGEGDSNNLAKVLDYLIYLGVLTAIVVSGFKVAKRFRKT